MKLTFKKLRYKNILSTGNVFTEIDFRRSKTTLVSGTNGAGKSTAVVALVFCLYGKPDRKITKNQLINSINEKELVTEVEFDSGDASYIVKRGIKPNFFEIWKNGKLINQDAASRDYQEMLEKTILKTSMKSFTQIVTLGSATYTPFMDLGAAARREFIEDLLDLQIFSTMNVLVKDKISQNKEQIKDNERDLEIIKVKIKTLTEQVNSLNKVREEEIEKIKTKALETFQLLKSKEDELKERSGAQEELLEKISDKDLIKGKHSKLKELKSSVSYRLRGIKDETAFYKDHDNCPTCKQGIAHEFKEETILKKNKTISELETAIEQLDKKLSVLDDELSEIASIESEIRAEDNRLSEIKSEIRFLKNSLVGYKKDLETSETKTVDASELVTFRKDQSELEKEQEQLFKSRELMSYAALMLKDTGIKSKIIKQFVPIMNKLINKYLAIFDLFVDFQLDENFNESIKSRHRDIFSYGSFSEGEKLRINMSILMAWRAISKMRNSVSTNLLFMDEVLDSGADIHGVEALLNIISDLEGDNNIFIISHRGETFAEKFESHIQFKKVKGFSEYSIVQ